MKNPMDRQLEKRLSDRAVAIGREGDVSAFGELPELLRSSSAKARRLAASAMGKLAWVGVDIEYWGLDNPQYRMSMYNKQVLYQQEGKRLISVYPKDLPTLGTLLSARLRLLGVSV
jgi:hypothetical protein